MSGGKEGHDIRSYDLVKQYFEDNNIEVKYKDEILEAIRLHSNASGSDNVMAIVLVFADKIDIKKTRLTPDGYGIIGLRQYQYIEDISILKEGNDFTVKFLIKGNCDKQELEEYYFTTKVFRAIKNFANYFGFNLKILWNDEDWNFEQNSNN